MLHIIYSWWHAFATGIIPYLLPERIVYGCFKRVWAYVQDGDLHYNPETCTCQQAGELWFKQRLDKSISDEFILPNDDDLQKFYDETMKEVPIIDLHGDPDGHLLGAMLNSTLSSADASNKRDRPYDGQAWTVQGIYGHNQVQGVTLRDLSDCFIKAIYMACGDESGKLQRMVENGEWSYAGVHDDCGDFVEDINLMILRDCLIYQVAEMMGLKK